MNGKNKKALLLCGLFLAVIAAGYANYAITAKRQEMKARKRSMRRFRMERRWMSLPALRTIAKAAGPAS